jgi:hypothetical protein
MNQNVMSLGKAFTIKPKAAQIMSTPPSAPFPS